VRCFDREEKLGKSGAVNCIKIFVDNQPRVIICRVPSYDKSGDPSKTQHGQEREDINKVFDMKLNFLRLTHSQANSATKNENLTAMERLHNTLATKVEEVHNLKVETQEFLT